MLGKYGIDIIDDEICEMEPDEHFFSCLSFVGGVLPIAVNPDSAQVIIDDRSEPDCRTLIPFSISNAQKLIIIIQSFPSHAGPITVGYEETVYTATEGMRSITPCAVITSHATGRTP